MIKFVHHSKTIVSHPYSIPLHDHYILPPSQTTWEMLQHFETLYSPFAEYVIGMDKSIPILLTGMGILQGILGVSLEDKGFSLKGFLDCNDHLTIKIEQL